MADPLDVVRCDVACLGATRELEWIRLRETRFGVADGSLLAHQFDDRIAPLDGALGRATRIVTLGRLGQSGEHRRLGDVEIARRFSEVPLRRRLDAVRAVAERDLIEVQLEDLVLRVLRLDGARDLRFLELAGQSREAAAVATVDRLGEDLSRELHRDGREALGESAMPDVGEDRAGDALPVDARVLIEPLVLRHHERVPDERRDLVDLQQRASLEPELGDEAAVDRVELRRLAGLVLIEHGDRGTGAGSADERPARKAEAYDECEAEREADGEPAQELRVPSTKLRDLLRERKGHLPRLGNRVSASRRCAGPTGRLTPATRTRIDTTRCGRLTI